jgi:hypothetical protein
LASFATVSTRRDPGGVSIEAVEKTQAASQYRALAVAALLVGVEPDGERPGLLRANKLFAGVWDSYDEIFAAYADAWNWFTDDPQPILGTRVGNSQCLGPLV